MKPYTLHCTPNLLQCNLADKITAAARQISDAKQGSIVIRFVAKQPSAAKWLGDLATCADDVNVDIDFVHSLIPGENKTRAAGWRGFPNCPPSACAGLAMMKIEACARAVVCGLGRCSEVLPQSMAIEGTCNRPGALCFDIDYTGADPGKDPWLRVYIGVDGANGEENKWCAYAARDTLWAYAKRAGFALTAPSYDPDAAVKSGLIKLNSASSPSSFSAIDTIC